MTQNPTARIFNKSRYEIAYLEPAFNQVSWMLNEAGQTQVALTFKDPKCTANILALGNYILLEWGDSRTQHLPIFGGVIDMPRTINSRGVQVTAYSGEYLLGWRETVQQDNYVEQSPGAIYESLIAQMKAISDPGVIIGDIYADGAPISKEWNKQNLLNVIRTLSTESGEDFDLMPSVEFGQIVFIANWYRKKGSDVSDKVLLSEGTNVGSATLDEQGPIGNSITVFGAGSTWGTTRLQATDADVLSQSTYQFRELSLLDQSAKDQGAVDLSAETFLTERKDPRRHLLLENVSDVEPGLFKDYTLGDTVMVDVLRRGGRNWRITDEQWRIVAMEWRNDNTLRLDLLPNPLFEDDTQWL